MTVLELKFPAGRYHATPWGRHVNEGAVEWPPSPWRILRALIATWHWKAKADVSELVIQSLLGSLAQPPHFQLPPATSAHTRHFMPIVEGKNEKRTKIFDTFIQLAETDRVLVWWDVNLPPEQLSALKTLADRVGYLGRAESLVEARVLDEVAGIEPNALPLAQGARTPEKTELVRVLTALNSSDYDKWRAEFHANNRPLDNDTKKSARKAKIVKAPDVPKDLFSALHADTGELQAAGWNLPPGAQFLNYSRPENAFAPATKPRYRRTGAIPTVARFALASAVPPSITKALAVAEQIHTVLCKKSNGHHTFTGAHAEGHRHAHIFCESIGDNNGHITHVTIFAEEGFDYGATEALRSLQWTWGFKGHDLRLVLHGIGTPDSFKECALFATATKWRSLTPFISTRHAKTYRDGRPKIDSANGWQIGSDAHDLLRLLALNERTEAAVIHQETEGSRPYGFGARRFQSLQFQTVRYSGLGSRGSGNGSAFSITLRKPVTGPIALGYGAHFGLGLFVPAGD